MTFQGRQSGGCLAAIPPDAKPENVVTAHVTQRTRRTAGSNENVPRLDTENMRSSKSRSRSKSNRNSGRSVGNIVNRVFDSSGPEGKVRGTPQQIIDKYNQLARDAQLGNDRVAAENFQQHAEHYLRMLSEAQREMDQRREQQERENRERQAERDRERAQRQEREGNAGGDQQQGKAKEQRQDDGAESAGAGNAEAPAEDSNLVETPESKPRKPRNARGRSGAPRKPKAERKADGGKDGGSESVQGNGQSPDEPAAAE